MLSQYKIVNLFAFCSLEYYILMRVPEYINIINILRNNETLLTCNMYTIIIKVLIYICIYVQNIIIKRVK